MTSDYFSSRYNYDPGRKKVWKAISEYLNQYIPAESTVLDLGSGYCDFINSVNAGNKYAVDSDQSSEEYCNADVTFICAKATELDLEQEKFDVIFASNFFEHLDDEELAIVFKKIRLSLKPGGKVIILQPNYYYAYREYWNDYTHKKAFSHTSLCDFLYSQKFQILKVYKRFLPFSFRSHLPKSYWITKFYLYFPLHPGAKQMLVIAEK
jgi:SAM-dependent methyltransferase